MKKTFFRYLIVFISLITGYLLFMLLGCLVPDKPVQRNIARSVPVFMNQWDYPYAVFEKPGCKLDNFTDALILNMAYHTNRDSLKTSILLNPYLHKDIYMTINLAKTVAGERDGTSYYSRYWHGSSFLMRFLLLLGNYEHIRQILFVTSMLLLLTAAAFIYREAGLPYMLGFFSGFTLLNGFIMQVSIQFFPVMAIALISSIVLCIKWRDFSSVLMIFFVAGSITSFFDLITIPLITMGMPLLLYLVLDRNTEEPWQKSLWEIVLIAAIWFAGYAVTWATKWIIATLATDVNVIQDATGVGLRYSQPADDGSRWTALTMNLQLLNFPLILSLLSITAIVSFLFSTKEVSSRHFSVYSPH